MPTLSPFDHRPWLRLVFVAILDTVMRDGIRQLRSVSVPVSADRRTVRSGSGQQHADARPRRAARRGARSSGSHRQPAWWADLARHRACGEVRARGGGRLAVEDLERASHSRASQPGQAQLRERRPRRPAVRRHATEGGRARHGACAVQVGTVWVNCYQVLDPAVPFGGYRASGYGRESGTKHMNEFLQTKAVWTRFT